MSRNRSEKFPRLLAKRSVKHYCTGEDGKQDTLLFEQLGDKLWRVTLKYTVHGVARAVVRRFDSLTVATYQFNRRYANYSFGIDFREDDGWVYIYDTHDKS